MASIQKATKSDFWRMTERKQDIIFYGLFIVPGYIAALVLAIATINLFTNWF